MKRPFEIYLLVLLLVFLSAGALYGGISFILSPDGSLLQMDPSWIEKIPFPNFLIPGLILIVSMGIFPLLALVGLFLRKNYPVCSLLNLFKDKYWGWSFTLYSGIISLIWIIVQQFVAGFFILQPVIAANGLLIIILCLIPRVQIYFRH